MSIARPSNPLVRTTIDLTLSNPDRVPSRRLFSGWGVEIPSNRVF